MLFFGKRESITLFVGDLLLFYLALFLTLFIRYGGFSDSFILEKHLYAFSLLFAAWFLVFFAAGLYERHTIMFRNRLPPIIFKTQVANTFIAVFFFYFIPYFKITPKVNLFIYLAISFVLTLIWRVYGYPLLAPKNKQNAILVGSGEELRELEYEINHNELSGIRFVSSFDITVAEPESVWKEIKAKVNPDNVSLLVLDFANSKMEPILSCIYNLMFLNVRFADMHRFYEETFGRIPLSLIHYNWFLENLSRSSRIVFDIFKRFMDIFISFFLGVFTLMVLPFVALAIKLDDGGVVFSYQKRVGKNNRLIDIIKFRSMNIANDEGKWGQAENKVTRAGRFLRKIRLDEFPQIWNVLKGDISLIGPRPEFPDAVKVYSEEIPYYNIRHLIKPGLSGWAQIYHENHPHHEADVKETLVKLSYDLYYIKNRCPMLDLKIALKTLKVLLSRSGI